MFQHFAGVYFPKTITFILCHEFKPSAKLKNSNPT